MHHWQKAFAHLCAIPSTQAHNIAGLQMACICNRPRLPGFQIPQSQAQYGKFNSKRFVDSQTFYGQKAPYKDTDMSLMTSCKG